jgi:Ca-activated chloride channel homolog
MFQFYTPWFIVLLPLPFIIMRFFSSKKNSGDAVPGLRFPAINRLQRTFFSQTKSSKQNYRLFYFLLWMSWMGLIFALMQPEKVDQYKQIKHEGYDLLLAVDISGSMQALDFATPSNRVSRLDVTKEVVGKFVQGRTGDRIGLITFGQHAYLHVPLTLDTASVVKMLENTVSGMAGNATAIGDAIGLSVRTLRDRPKGSRVLVLLTDGADNSSSIPPMEAAKLASEYGIRIYTIGVGKNGPVPFPMPGGGHAMAEITMDETLLQEIAKKTGGQYFLATNQKALESIYQKIDELEKSESDERTLYTRDPLYTYPLMGAILFFFFLLLHQMRQVIWRTINGT